MCYKNPSFTRTKPVASVSQLITCHIGTSSGERPFVHQEREVIYKFWCSTATATLLLPCLLSCDLLTILNRFLFPNSDLKLSLSLQQFSYKIQHILTTLRHVTHTHVFLHGDFLRRIYYCPSYMHRLIHSHTERFNLHAHNKTPCKYNTNANRVLTVHDTIYENMWTEIFHVFGSFRMNFWLGRCHGNRWLPFTSRWFLLLKSMASAVLCVLDLKY